jgi:hypothetical protein
MALEKGKASPARSHLVSPRAVEAVWFDEID